MEARNVNIYFIPVDKNKIGGRFYSIYLNKSESLNLSYFLNSIYDIEQLDKIEKGQVVKKLKGIVKNEQTKEYDVILTFNNSKNNKNYIIYTDNLYDSFGKLKIFSAIYDDDLPEPFVGYPITNDEWNDIYKLLDSVILNNVV